MSSTMNWTRMISLAALTAGLALPSQANAGNLFDALFGGGIKKQRVTEFPSAPPAKRVVAPKSAAPKAAAAVRISAPSYYTYRPDALVRVDFAAMAPITTGAIAVSYTPSPSDFGDALGRLGNYDLFAEKDVAKALVDHYLVDPRFVWISDGTPNAKAREAMQVLGEADKVGLRASDYAVGPPDAAASGDATTQTSPALMAFEMTLSARVLRYFRDASIGRIDPNRISGYYDFAAKPVDLNGALAALAGIEKVGPYLEARNPQSADFRALTAELAGLEAAADEDVAIDPKLLLKPGQTSEELPKLLGVIARGLDDEMGGDFGETLARLGQSTTYVDELKPVIQAMQKRAGLKADGVIGPRTVAIFVGTSKADRIEKVKVALEQLRWLPDDLGSPRVFINQPAFTASYIDGGEAKLSMRVVVGSPSTQTSFFNDEIETVDYNPYWGVPQSIIVNEMLPRLRNDPGYLDRAGYEVTDAKGKKVPSSSINWAQYGSKVPYNVRQTPSEANALGELKILFPNKHAIYMHDTPSKSFFARDMRALSHGCIRLQDPRGMAAAVLGTTVEHVADKLAQGHSSEKLTRKVPVYVAYFTAWPTMNGKVEYFADVYGRDAKLKLALDATEATRIPAM